MIIIKFKGSKSWVCCVWKVKTDKSIAQDINMEAGCGNDMIIASNL